MGMLVDEGRMSLDEPLGLDPESGKPIFLKKGRFGPYIQLGTAEDSEKRKR